MGQGEVYEILCSNEGKKYTTSDLAEMMGMNQHTIARNCTRLVRAKFVRMEIVKCEKQHPKYYYTLETINV